MSQGNQDGRVDRDYEQKGGYPAGPRPEGKPPIPPLFQPFDPSAPTPAEAPEQAPPPEASTEQD